MPSNLVSNILRPKELGLLVVVGGPGGSGSSTISRILAEKWYLHRLYAGDLIRERAKNNSVEDYINKELKYDSEVDKNVDKYLMKMSFQKNILIESKVFAALSTISHIPTTIKIWLSADIKTSVKRIFQRESWAFNQSDISKEFEKLERRRQNDIERFKNLYNVDISKPEKYNDIVIDSSKLDVYNTTKAIIDKIKSDPFLYSRFPSDYLKY